MLRISSIQLLWLIACSMAVTVDDQPYCTVRYRRLCQSKGKHVACEFTEPGPGDSCQNYTAIKFTSELKHFITHYINRRRQRIASGNEKVRGGIRLPKPEIMMFVEWDRELAFLAQRLADQCNFAHDDCRATVRYPYAGQTVGEVRWRRLSESDELSAQRAIRRVLDAWWGERRRVYPKQLTAPFRITAKGSVWGHFSQLAVWTLRAVGCGAVRHGANFYKLLLVCDFSHTNMLGERTIVPGRLAPCPIHTVRRPRTAYPLLCASVRLLKPEEQPEKTTTDGYDEYGTDDDHHTTDSVLTLTPNFKSRTSWKVKLSTKVDEHETKQFLTLRNRQPTKGVMIDKLEQEMMIRNKQDSKNVMAQSRFLEWSSRKPHFGQWRMKQENADEIPPNWKPSSSPIAENEAGDHYQFTARTAGFVYVQEPAQRQRWKQTRDRPRRPGANALLNIPTEKPVRRSSVVSLLLDKEDVDQLFQDTGFNLHWRNHKTSR